MTFCSKNTGLASNQRFIDVNKLSYARCLLTDGPYYSSNNSCYTEAFNVAVDQQEL